MSILLTSRQFLKPQILRYSVTRPINNFRKFSGVAVPPLTDWDKEMVQELYKSVDMDELAQFNPKLHQKLEQKPELILDLKEVIMANESTGDNLATAESVAAASDDLGFKPQKNFSMPFIWAYFTPVFTVTAAGLVKLQAFTQIPWMSFIILSGVSVRLCILPLMIRQMTLINKMSQASPNIRLAAKLFKHSKLPLYSRCYHLGKAFLDYQRQTKTSLMQFYFCNIIQLPVFIIMVLSIRKISFENEELTGAGMLWFPNLNEPDPFLILPITAAMLNYFNLSRGITKENEHWYINRFRTFFSVLQFFHLPFTHTWPAGAFLYWISSSSFMFVQSTLMRKPWFLNKVNPNFFYDYAKMFGERSPKDHDNCVERILNSQDHRLKQTTYNQVVLDDLQEEMNKFMAMQRGKRIQSAKVNMVGSKKE